MRDYKHWITERKANTSEYKGTTSLSDDEVIDIIKNLKDFSIDDELWLWRSIDLPESQYMVDPTKDRREWVVGALPTLVMEYEPSWENFPSRMTSLFMVNGTDDVNPTKAYASKSYRVIPLDGANFGVSSTSNYKLSFDKLNRMDTNASAFFYVLKNIYTNLVGGTFDIPIGKRIKNYINEDNYQLLKDEIDELIMVANNVKVGHKPFQEYTKFKDAEEFLNHFFNAEENGFISTSYNGLKMLNPNNQVEIWTDSPCLLITKKQYKKLFNI